MVIMKTYSEEEMEYLNKPLKNDGYKLLIQPERLNPEDSNIYSEFGCSIPVNFITSKGIKRLEPGKRYDTNLNEIE